jgi:hypothetical protein
VGSLAFVDPVVGRVVQVNGRLAGRLFDRNREAGLAVLFGLEVDRQECSAPRAIHLGSVAIDRESVFGMAHSI